jgi:prepilin-type N-terminal cleavage/methylation domain-containing protein
MRARARGFTLIELLVAMALGAILVGVTSFIFINAKQLYDHSLQEIATSNELRGGFDRLGRDLHDVQPNPTNGWQCGVRELNDPTNGPEDQLEYVTLERTETTSTPVKVQVRLGARDGDGLAPLIRSVTHRGFVPATMQLIAVAQEDQVLLNRVRSFRVEYAWPSQGLPEPVPDAATPTGSYAGHVFVRGSGRGPWSGPSPGAGVRFLYAGSGEIASNVLTISSAPYDTGGRVVPRQLAHRVFVTYQAAPTVVQAFPVVDVTSPTQLTLTGAIDGTVTSFWMPLLPDALQVTVNHESRNGPRSVTEVLKLSP